MAANPAFQQASQRTQLDVFLGKAENHLAGAAWATIGRMRLAAEDVDATFQAAQQGLRADADRIPCGKRLRCNAG